MHLPGANSRKVVVEVVTVLENLALGVDDGLVDVLDEAWRFLEIRAERVKSGAEGWVDLLTETRTKGDSRAHGAQHASTGHLINAVPSLSSFVGEVGVDVHEVVPDDDHTIPLDL